VPAEAPAPTSAAPEAESIWSPVVERLRAALAGELEIEGELGHGGMAAVFRARELALNRRVAIKVMAPGLLLGEGMVDRFRQEAITVANLQHANIVAVHGVRTVEDLHLFVMQYIPGRSLERVLRDQGRLSLTATRAILYHVGSALDYAHRRGVIHRDVKPANIILDADGDPVVTDFGIAKVAETPGYTRVGTVVGTPAYMSPEQCMGYDVGPASDQYALGIVAYEMLSGQTPFTGGGLALMRAHTDHEPPPLRAARADVPERLEAAVMRMLAKKPEARFPDLAAAIDALEAHPLSALGPVRAEMSALAGAADAETSLAEIVRAPRSPAPASPVPSPPVSDRGAKTIRSGVKSIALGAPAEPMEVGDCVVIEATPQTESGARASHVRLTWASSNPDVAAVDAAGVVTAKSVGAAAISASAGSIRSSVDVAVVDPRVTAIEIDAPAEVRAGARATLSARALDRHGHTVDALVTWVSRNESVASVNDTGSLTAKRRGSAVIVAQAVDVARAVTITITAAPVRDVVIDGVPPVLVVGRTAMVRAIVRAGRAGDDDRPRDIEWKSSDPGIATIAADGTLTARSPGRATITATADGVRGEARVTVVSVPAHSIVVVAPPSPLRLGDRVSLEATVYDAAGRTLDRQVAWRSSDPRVVSVDSDGRLVAQAEGWSIITAEADGIEAHTEAVVRQQIVPVSAAGRRESRRLALNWWIFLILLGGVIALGWHFLVR
jgi:serine/threonine-protein kinase